MKSVVDSFCTAFSLYSAIPMPNIKWDRNNMRYALCFFPLIGMLTGILILLWLAFCQHFEVSAGFFAALAVLIPLLVSGGIHMDGFIDTFDAASSHAMPERKLEILKDPHVGAFGVLSCVCYLLLQFGLWQQLYAKPWLIALPATGYILSRSLNAFSIATFPTARNSGLVHAFASTAARTAVKITCVLYSVAAAAICVFISLLWGAVLIAASFVFFILHKRFCMWEFSGNTGDLAGFLLQNIELIALIIAVIGGVVGA